MMRHFLSCFAVLSFTLFVACSAQQFLIQQDDGASVQHIGLNPSDPWEHYNRKIFVFNDWLDSKILKPVAIGYDLAVPKFGQAGVRNFFSNLGEVSSIANNVFQFDIDGTVVSFMRLSVNSTFGLLGVIDVATEVGMRKDSEDFGQTLGVWGINAGNYLVIPFLGPSGTRDIFRYSDILYYDKYDVISDSTRKRYLAMSANVVQTRADLLALESQIVGDRYVFIRDAYLQNREFLVQDGVNDDSFFDKSEEVGDDDF